LLPGFREERGLCVLVWSGSGLEPSGKQTLILQFYEDEVGHHFRCDSDGVWVMHKSCECVTLKYDVGVLVWIYSLDDFLIKYFWVYGINDLN
jgi:hypothetical protein